MDHDLAPDRAWSSRAVVGSALAIALLPLLVAAVAALVHGSGAFIRDEALIELRVRDVGLHPVLVGLYSRDGWSHPGPLVFYTLAIPYRLLGSQPAGLLVGALAINASAIAGMTLIAKRLGGVAAALLTAVGATIVAGALGASVLFDPWVCFVSVLPFGLFCYLAWAMVEREAWALPCAAALASWLTQVHVGYAPLTAPLLGVGALWLWISARRLGEPARSRRVLRATALAGGLLLLLWIPTIWDQLFGSGNLGKFVDWFARGREGTHTITEGARVVLAQFALLPDWITGVRRVGFNGATTLPATTLVPMLLVPFFLACLVAWRREDRNVVHLAGVCALITVSGVFAVARTIGIMYEYRLLWTWCVGMLGGVVIAWTGWKLVVTRWPRSEKAVLIPVALVSMIILGGVELTDVADHSSATLYSSAARRVTDELSTRLDRSRGQVVLRSASPDGEWYLQGLVLGLERNGIDARVEGDVSQRFGHHRVVTDGSVAARLLVLADNDLAEFTPDPDSKLVAYDGPVPLDRYAAVSRRVAAKDQRLLAALDAGDLTPDDYLDALKRVDRPGPTVAIYREDQ